MYLFLLIWSHMLVNFLLLDITDSLPNNPLLKCNLCTQRLEDTHFVQVTKWWYLKKCIKILVTSALLWVITNFASLARPTQSRSREQTMKYSVRVGSAAPSRAPTCPGPSCRGRSPPSWPRARRPSRRRTRTNEQQRTNQILYSMLETKKQCIWFLDSFSHVMQLFEVKFFLLSV